jgi:hypothetical protein
MMNTICWVATPYSSEKPPEEGAKQVTNEKHAIYL